MQDGNLKLNTEPSEIKNTDQQKSKDTTTRVEIVNLPKQRKQNNVVAWFGLGVSILVGIFSVYAFHKSLPTQEANVVFSESDVHIIPTEKCKELNQELKSKSCDLINLSLTNNGSVNAEKINYSVYAIYPNKEVQEMFYDEGIKNILPPGGIATVNGVIIAPHYSQEGFDMRKYGMQQILIFFIEYSDEISGRKGNMFYFSQYIGHDKVYNLSEYEYKSIEESFKNYLTEHNRLNILHYLTN